MSNNRGNAASGKVYPKDVGVIYKKTYTDKKTGEDRPYLRIQIFQDQLANLVANEKGIISLSAFPLVTNKRSETTPDLTIKAQSSGSNAASKGGSARGHKADFSF